MRTLALTVLALTCAPVRPGSAQTAAGSGALVQVGPNGVTATQGNPGQAGGPGCPDGRRQVTGSGHELTLAGPCQLLEVSGSRNTVHVRLAPAARVVIAGTGNRVVWSAADLAGAPPTFEVNGTRNSHTQAR